MHAVYLCIHITLHFAAKEEGNFFQGDIRLTAEDDPYDLFSNVRVFKRTAFDGSGAGETNSSALNARLWPDGYVPYVYHRRLSKCVFLPIRCADLLRGVGACLQFLHFPS